MSVNARMYRVLVFFASVTTLASVCDAYPIQTHAEVHSDALYNGVGMDRVDGLGFDPWPAEVYQDLSAEEIDSTTEFNNTNSTAAEGEKNPEEELDPWSLVWYIGSFGALVGFFLVVSCSECCCAKVPSGTACSPPSSPDDIGPPQDDGPPPPPYELFAPPPYDTLFNDTENKDKIAVFVVPVHQTPHPPP